MIFGLIFILLIIFFILCFQNLFYPLKFEDEIAVYAEKSGVSAYVIASVVNCESHFKTDVVSSKGAVGLMQIMPSTAMWISERINEEYFDGLLFDAEKNIEYGSFYLAYLIDCFEDLDLALCAYNAGLGRVNSWLSNEEYSSDGKSLQKIPFPETANYLKKVKKNMTYYKNKV